MGCPLGSEAIDEDWATPGLGYTRSPDSVLLQSAPSAPDDSVESQSRGYCLDSAWWLSLVALWLRNQPGAACLRSGIATVGAFSHLIKRLTGVNPGPGPRRLFSIAAISGFAVFVRTLTGRGFGFARAYCVRHEAHNYYKYVLVQMWLSDGGGRKPSSRVSQGVTKGG